MIYIRMIPPPIDPKVGPVGHGDFHAGGPHKGFGIVVLIMGRFGHLVSLGPQ